MFVRGIVVANDVNRYSGRIALIRFKNRIHPDGGVWHTSFQDRTIERVECREQRGCAVAFVIRGSSSPQRPFFRGSPG
jgi:hypothetical protein